MQIIQKQTLLLQNPDLYNKINQKIMNQLTKCKCVIIFICLLLTPVLFLILNSLPLINNLHWKIYDKLAVIETKLNPAPPSAKDILLVVIDNKTLTQLPDRWPYPRAYFAQVVDNLNKAGAKLIGFDFVFLGRSSSEDDLYLKESFQQQKNIVLATTINEQGEIDLFSSQNLSSNIPTGIVTKLQDKDEIIRRSMSFLINEKNPRQIFPSWETQLLNQIKHIDPWSLNHENSMLSFHNNAGEKWEIPVDPVTDNFLIHFRCNTSSFARISFSDILNDNFNPAIIKNKIVLIGFLSQTFGNIHYTPLQRLPGITINANAFLTLYTHNFIKGTSHYIEFSVLLIGIIIACFILCSFNLKKAFLMIITEICIFFALSYLLLTKGFIWHYSLFPIMVLISPLLSERAFALFWRYETILFVNKDTSLRNIFYKTFTGLEYKITTIRSNKEIIEILKTFRPHYVVVDPTDTNTPAPELAKQIKLISPDINIIIARPKINSQQFIHNILLDIKYKQYYTDTQKAEPNLAIQQNTGPNEPPDKKILRKLHVLIIDDEKECVDLIKSYLSKRGHSIESAYSGEEALYKINEHRPDLVMLDIRMQGIDGLVVLKSIDKSIAVIMTTAVADQTVIKEASGLGANHYLIKPFSFQELEKIIRGYVC